MILNVIYNLTKNIILIKKCEQNYLNSISQLFHLLDQVLYHLGIFNHIGHHSSQKSLVILLLVNNNSKSSYSQEVNLIIHLSECKQLNINKIVLLKKLLYQFLKNKVYRKHNLNHKINIFFNDIRGMYIYF